jgi:spore germination protein GerM
MKPAYIIIALGGILILGGLLFSLGSRMGERQTQVVVTPTPVVSPAPSPGDQAITESPDASPQAIAPQVYFSHPQRMGNDCSQVFAVERELTATQNLERAALEELLRGPTAAERNQGYTTNIPSGAQIQSFAVDAAGTARVDFDQRLEQGVAGSCRVMAIRSEITQTLLQFPNISSVVISINGRTEDILQP